MPHFIVDATKCRKDGICSRLCPAGIITPNDDGLPIVIEERVKYCIGCGHCVAFCPHAASRLEGLPMELVKPLVKSLIPTEESVREQFKARRSIRAFKDKQVPKDEVLKIFDMIREVPSASNRRSIRWIIINTKKQMDKLNELITDDFEKFGNTPPVSEIKAMSRLLASSHRKGADPFFRGAHQLAIAVYPEGFSFGVSDAAIALTYFELAAASLGIGCCWAGYFTTAAKRSFELRATLGLDESEIVGGGQMFGYPSLKAFSSTPRADISVEWVD